MSPAIIALFATHGICATLSMLTSSQSSIVKTKLEARSKPTYAFIRSKKRVRLRNSQGGEKANLRYGRADVYRLTDTGEIPHSRDVHGGDGETITAKVWRLVEDEFRSEADAVKERWTVKKNLNSELRQTARMRTSKSNDGEDEEATQSEISHEKEPAPTKKDSMTSRRKTEQGSLQTKHLCLNRHLHGRSGGQRRNNASTLNETMHHTSTRREQSITNEPHSSLSASNTSHPARSISTYERLAPVKPTFNVPCPIPGFVSPKPQQVAGATPFKLPRMSPEQSMGFVFGKPTLDTMASRLSSGDKGSTIKTVASSKGKHKVGNEDFEGHSTEFQTTGRRKKIPGGE